MGFWDYVRPRFENALNSSEGAVCHLSFVFVTVSYIIVCAAVCRSAVCRVACDGLPRAAPSRAAGAAGARNDAAQGQEDSVSTQLHHLSV